VDPSIFPWHNDPRLKEADRLLASGFYAEADKTLQEIITNETPGSLVGGAARMARAKVEYEQGHLASATQIVQEVVDRYPETALGLLAKASLNSLKYADDSDEVRLQHDDALILEAGGIPIGEALRQMNSRYKARYDGGDDARMPSRQLFTRVPYLNEEVQSYLLSDFYYEVAAMWLGLASPTVPTDKVAAAEYDPMKVVNPFRLFHFVRETFPQTSETIDQDVIFNIQDVILTAHHILDRSAFPEDVVAPQVRQTAPSNGAFVWDSHPEIQGFLDDGDIRSSQIDIPAIEFTLDGVDLTERMAIRTTYDTSARFDVVFERMRLGYRPATALKPGAHAVSLKVPDHDGNVSEKTWTFIVCARGGRSDDHGSEGRDRDESPRPSDGHEHPGEGSHSASDWTGWLRTSLTVTLKEQVDRSLEAFLYAFHLCLHRYSGQTSNGGAGVSLIKRDGAVAARVHPRIE
jgi:hypothetical protein